MDTNNIKRIISNFLSDSDVQVEGEASGEYNKVYLLETSSGKYALRVKRKPLSIDAQALAYEMEFIERLGSAQNKIHVPHTIRTKSGEYLFVDKDAYYNLQTLVPGAKRIDKWYESGSLAVSDVAELFSTLALLHRACRGVKMTHTKYSPTVYELFAGYRMMLEKGLPDGPFNNMLKAERTFLEDKLHGVEKRLNELGYGECASYPVHYDTSACNVLWDAGQIISLIDFDWVQKATFEFDFARSVMLTCGGYTQSGNSTNTLDPVKVRTALSSYNASSEEPLEQMEMTRSLIDASSLFLTFWAVRTFIEEGNREPYFLSFFQSGLDRLRDAPALL